MNLHTYIERHEVSRWAGEDSLHPNTEVLPSTSDNGVAPDTVSASGALEAVEGHRV